MAFVNEYAPDEVDIILLEKNIILVKGHSSL